MDRTRRVCRSARARRWSASASRACCARSARSPAPGVGCGCRSAIWIGAGMSSSLFGVSRRGAGLSVRSCWCSPVPRHMDVPRPCEGDRRSSYGERPIRGSELKLSHYHRRRAAAAGIDQRARRAARARAACMLLELCHTWNRERGIRPLGTSSTPTAPWTGPKTRPVGEEMPGDQLVRWALGNRWQLRCHAAESR